MELSLTFDRPSTSDDVTSAYLVLLGRPPEGPAVVGQYTGSPIAETISSLISSEEFSLVAREVLAGADLPHFRALSERNRRDAAEWIKLITNGEEVDHFSSWWCLVDRLFKHSQVKDMIVSTENGPYASIVEKRYHIEGRVSEKITRFFKLNMGWLRQKYPPIQALVEDNGCLDREFLSDSLTVNRQLFPAFSEGLEEAYPSPRGDPKPTFNDVQQHLRHALEAGKLGHWLFEQRFFAAAFDVEELDELHQTRKKKAGYLEFLAFGDEHGIPPHPLFSHAAYSHLNDGFSSDERHSFEHYITTGTFTGFHTSALFDADFYLAANQSARSAISSGDYKSPLHHFVALGMAQDLAFSPDFDSGFYREKYPEAVAAVAAGEAPSISWEFLFIGLREGRMPNPYFSPDYYVLRYPGVLQEMKTLGIGSALEHFLLVGRARGYKASDQLGDQVPPQLGAKAVFARRALRSMNSLVRRPLDFRIDSERPIAVSMIVPVCNEVAFTCRVLECAYFAAAYFRQATDLNVEVVIVDNGSEDGTAEIVKRCGGVRLVSFDRPIGYPRAANAGVAAARGDVVIIANNDIEFEPDTFLNVYSRLSNDNSIGVLGAMTILANEALQEFGSFIDSSGGVVGLGREQNPWDQYYQGLRLVDFCSGCFLSARRNEFEFVGGFDEAYSPGYYEDVDFCLRLKSLLGKAVYVDSQVQITHFEHASFGKGRPPTSAYSTIARNRSLLLSRHQEALARFPSPVSFSKRGDASPRDVRRTRLLIIVDSLPDPFSSAREARRIHILEGLARREIAFDILAINASKTADDYPDPRVRISRAWMAGRPTSAVLADTVSKYSHVIVFGAKTLAALNLEMLQFENDFRIICDAEVLSSTSFLEKERISGSQASRVSELAAVRSELEISAKISHWAVSNSLDKQRVQAAGLGAVSLLGYRVQPAVKSSKAWDERKRVTIVSSALELSSGSYESVTWFLQRVAPKCTDLFRELKLTVVGMWAPELKAKVERIALAIGIDFIGAASQAELINIYQQTRVVVIPLRYGEADPMAAFEGMALGVPTVLTDTLERRIVSTELIGKSGLMVGSGRDDGASLANCLQILATDKTEWERVRVLQEIFAGTSASPATFDQYLDEFVAKAGLLNAET